MARRRRRYRRSRRGVEIAQLIMLVVLLVAVLFFRNKVGEISAKLINVFGPSEDVRLNEAPADPTVSVEPESDKPAP